MTITETIDRVVTHPLTAISILVGALGTVLPIPVLSALLEVVWAQAGTVFAAVSLTATQGWLPSGTAEVVVFLAAALWFGRMLYKLYRGLDRRVSS